MKYGLIGKTLVHSYSKEIHEALGKYSYGLFSLDPDELADFIKTKDFNGLNVTIPYKKDVIPLCDEISELASEIGAVNTLYRKGQSLIGHNTDYEGFLFTAKRSGISFSGKNVLILGTGGTSLTARKAVKDQGAKRVYIVSRSAAGDLTYDELDKVAGEIHVIVNTTPIGTFPNNMNSVLDVSAFPDCEAVIDVIYNPFKTKLILDAEKKGLKTANGLPMLVAQATAAAGYFLGTPGAYECENEKIIKDLQSNMQNIVLIGMPGCGKSTIGQILSESTGKTLVDMDEEIIKKAGKTIPEIFEKSGEQAFRDLESEVAAELGKQRGLIIATGGGVVLRPENIDCLKQNGFIIHIKRPVDDLPTHGRPLSKDNHTLRIMETERMPLYEAAADITFDNSKSLRQSALADTVLNTLSL